MAEYFSPGVYVEEYDSSPRAIEGVGSSTAGFIGMAVKGPTFGAPSYVTSFAEYQRQFGGYLTEYTHGEYRYMGSAVEQFFANGGARCFVSRVVPGDATIASAQKKIISLRAANEGKWGNKIVMAFVSSNRKKMQLLKKEGEFIYTAKSINGFREGDLVELAGEINRITTIYENMITFEKEFSTECVDTALVPKIVLYSVEMDITIKYENEIENFNGLNLNPTSPNYIVKKLSRSNLVVATVQETSNLENPVFAILGNNVISGSFLLEGGSDGSMDEVSADTFIGEDGGPGKRTGIQSFIENERVSIIAVPGITIAEVVVALVAHCENSKRRVAVIDVPQDIVKLDDIIEYRSLIDSTYAAIYHPWIQVFDRAARKPSMIPPSGAIMGIYSRTDATRGVHKAPANETVSCTGLSTYFNTSEQDILNPAGVNLIRSIPGQGIRVWGARTASSNSTFKYINVRRLFIFVETSIQAATNWVVFEPNNASLWSRVQMTISSFLEGMFRSGMLAGDSESEAFFVNIGVSTMSKSDIMNGKLICEIGISPVKPAEFVIFKVSQFTSEAAVAEESASEA